MVVRLATRTTTAHLDTGNTHDSCHHANNANQNYNENITHNIRDNTYTVALASTATTTQTCYDNNI